MNFPSTMSSTASTADAGILLHLDLEDVDKGIGRPPEQEPHEESARFEAMPAKGKTA
jgi:hypothetical protein